MIVFEDWNEDIGNYFHGTQNIPSQIMTAVIMRQLLPEMIDEMPEGPAKDLVFQLCGQTDRDAGPKCPVDNEHLDERQLNPDNFARRELLNHPVFCRWKKLYGCPWKGPLGKLEVMGPERRASSEEIECMEYLDIIV